VHENDQARIQSSFQPAEVTFAGFPKYPHGALLLAATVILEATVNEAGKVQSTMVLRDVPPFTAKAIQAVGDWRFMPATLSGKRVESRVVLAFNFRQPVGN
jgi:TonB family protein